MSLTWYPAQIKQQIPGNYGAPTTISITDAIAVEIVPSAGSHRYLTLSNKGPGNIYVRIDGDATTSEYNFILPEGYNQWGKKISAQKITGICKTGETAKLMIAIAPEITL